MKLLEVGPCKFCGDYTEIELSEVDYDKAIAYKEARSRGESVYIQQELPSLSPTKREAIMTGMCLSCQDKIFNPSWLDDSDEDEIEDNLKDFGIGEEFDDFEGEELDEILDEIKEGELEW